ncbi:HNH endonuclease, partial [Mycolicibacterium phlei DSM 43239 = CCUG 21000]
HDAPNAGGRHLGMARALVEEMPYTLAALECGALSEYRAMLIVRESACLSVEHRRDLDARLCADITRLAGWGDKRIAAQARQIACELDVAAVVDRSAKAPTDRNLTIRPAPDAMVYVTAHLPVAQGVSVYATLKRQADTTFDGRTRGQVMADTLVERITGRPAAPRGQVMADTLVDRIPGRPAARPADVMVNLVMADTTLMGDDDAPAWLQGYGPLPAAIARGLTGDAVR